jgi:hypothetical protein
MKLNYWGIPKSGNTSLKICLLKSTDKRISRTGDIYQAWAHSEDNIKYITKEEAIENGYLNFTVVRDPYTRFESMLKDIKRRNGQFFKGKKIETIEDFFNYLEKTEDNKRNVHFRSQSYFITKDNKLALENVFKLENTEEIEHFINLKLEKYNSIFSNITQFTGIEKERIYKIYKNDFKILGYNK